ncbi:hypothetical protein B0T21DRAFT_346874 [Apiosordaria backusii]|uniref:Uncharacterized protein n=1 Tax=Apiosordaria backusii TaxID=314023 RepID=A0AA40BSN5_9PEZI|nr:hypothetical protein B0T21DRAFT_346874 [Apiosordaria backusii]
MSPSPDSPQLVSGSGSGSASQSLPPSSLNPLTTATGLVVIILISTISIGVAIALLLLYLRKRKRSAQRRLTARLSGMPEIRAGDSTETERSHIASTVNGTERNRLQKFGGGGSKEGVFEVVERGRGMLRRLTEEGGDSVVDDDMEGKGRDKGLGRSQSCAWPSSVATGEEDKKLERAFSNRAKPNWVDGDLLHGPVTSIAAPAVPEMPKRSFFRGGSLKEKGERGSWPMRELGKGNTLPRVHHTVHGYPSGGCSAAARAWGRQQEEKEREIGLGSDKIRGYGCLRLGAGFAGGGRVLPEPPRKAVVAGTGGSVVRSNTVGAVVGGYGQQQQQQVQVQQRVVPPPPPHRSLPQTPPRAVARGRSRAQSTDSTLSEILKSTEKRLRAGSVNGGVGRGRHMRMGSLNARTMSLAGTSQECLLPKKTAGHKRQDSEVSAVSESDSLAGDESPVENPVGLTSPSRSALVQKQESQQQPEREVTMVIQSPRSSISSSLSTVFSEDEMPDEVKKAIMPLDGFVVAPQPAASVQPPVMNDPFITAPVPLPLSINRYSPSTTAIGLRQQQPKTQGLFRESLERSAIQRRMTVGSPTQDLILAPGPSVGPGSKLIQQQDDTPRMPTGPLFLRLTKTSTLSTIPILPPPAAPGPVFTQHQQRRKTLSPVKTVSFADELPQVHNVPRHSPTVCPPSPTRVSKKPGIKMSPSQHQLQLSLSRNGNRDSICSTYSVENPPVSVLKKSATAAQEVNSASFFANSLLYPDPLNLNLSKSSSSSVAVSPSSPDSDVDDAAGSGSNSEEDEDDIPLANTVASLRRMNSQMSTSSVVSLHNENPKRFSGNLQNFQKRKSMGGRNYLALGGNVNTAQRRKRSQSIANGSGSGSGVVQHGRSQSQPALPPIKRPGSRVVSGNAIGILNASLSQASLGSPRVSREVIPLAYPVDKRQSGWEWGGNVVAGSSGGLSPPHKRRKPGSVHERRQSLLRMSVLESVPDASSPNVENNNKENNDNEGFKLPVREEFTFHSGYAGLGGSMSLGNFGTPTRGGDRSPGRSSVKSVESLGLYDRQGFLITSPVRNGGVGGTGSPLRGLMVQQDRLQSSPSRLRV